MNQPVSHNILSARNPSELGDDAFDMAVYLTAILDNRWLIAAIVAFVTVLGATYALVATPIYRANLLIQVEDGANSPSMLLGDLAGAFDTKSPAAAEIEILRSRYVLSRAADNAGLDVIAVPKRFPVIGSWIARGRTDLPSAGVLGYGGYAWGAEKANVTEFRLPVALEGEEFVITSLGRNRYRLSHEGGQLSVEGEVGADLYATSAAGPIHLRVDSLKAGLGAQFRLAKVPLLSVVEQLQKSLSIDEKGKQTGILGVTLEGPDPSKTALILNEIGREYVRQNVERKSEEARKSLAFLEKQLPDMKRNLENTEAAYNKLRNNRGTVNLEAEAKSILEQSVLSQSTLLELKQKRDDLMTRFQSTNQVVEAVDRQIATLTADIAALNAKIRQMPQIEQDILRLTRDIKVTTDLYTALLNSAQQLRLVEASKVGNARVIDTAVVPLVAVRPNRGTIVIMSVMAGVILGVATAFFRKSLFGGIEDPTEIEQRLGISISAAIPHSAEQDRLFDELHESSGKVSLLAHHDPTDLAIEGLRGLRTSLQFTMLNAKNKIVMITGPVPQVGKSFVSANLAAVLAAAGKRVLLIDGDIRKGYLNRYFGVGRERGLSEIISGTVDRENAIHKNVVENVDFIPTGIFPPKPAELLEHPRFGALLKDVASDYDIVLIDTAPVLPVTDALIIASHCATIFTVVRGGSTPLGEIEETIKRLTQGGHHVAGVIFNGLRHRSAYGIGSKYGRYRYAQYKY